jgi:hypothetical protein
MQVFRRAAVLILLGLSLGISGAHAATVHSEVRPGGSKTTPRGAIDRFGSWWNLFTGVWNKEGCRIAPLGRCGVSPATQTSNTADAGCTIDPLGRCLTGH